MAVVAIVVVWARGGSSTSATAAELYAKQIQIGDFGRYQHGIDPDELDRSSSDVTTAIASLGHDHYALTVQNTSNVGFINSFTWHVSDMKITSVSNPASGSCELTDPTSFVCTGMAVKPPKCTCKPGGVVTIRFVATPLVRDLAKGVSHGVQNSKLTLGDMTPVPYHIPSYEGGAGNRVDLPLCAPGQASSKANPCVHGR